MRIVRIAAVAVIAVIIGGALVLKSLTTYIPVGQVGVRTQQYALFGSKGVVQEDFGPGWHRDLGPIDTWIYYDSTVQTLEMTRDPSRGSRSGRDDVQVRSADGYTVSVDVTIKYRIKPTFAHKLYQDTGSRDKYKTIVRNASEEACLSMFGQMKTEDFYNPHVRRSRAAEVETLLRSSLEDNYVDVIDVLMREVEFDPGYEAKIRRKKLADQEVKLNNATERAIDQQGERENIEEKTRANVTVIEEEQRAKIVTMKADTDLKIATIKAAADKYVTEKRADADLVNAELGAKGDLVVKQAEAEGERLRNAAMLGVGGRTIVALEAARNLNLGNITISPLEVDLLDIDGMATRRGGPERSGR